MIKKIGHCKRGCIVLSKDNVNSQETFVEKYIIK